MATLPDYTSLGQRPVSTAFAAPAVDRSGSIQDQSMAQASETLGNIADQAFVQRTNLARAKAANALLDHEINVESATNDIERKVQTGEIPYQQAKQTWQDTVGKMQPPQVEYLDQVGQENLKKGAQRILFTQGVRLNGIVQQAQRNDFKDQFTDNLDKLGKLAGMPGADIESINLRADAFAPLARNAGIPPKQVDKAIQDFKDQNWFNNAQQNAMQSKDSMPDLKQLEHDLTDEDGFYAGKLDTNKRNAVLRTVINDRLILEQRAERLQEKREVAGQRALMQIDTQISSGVPATAAMWDAWQHTVKGTEAAPDFQQRMEDETKVQQVLRQPVDQQMKFIQERQTTLDSQGGSLRDLANLNRLKGAVSQNVRMLQSQPLLFNSNRTGQDIQPLDLSTLGTSQSQTDIASQISDRMNTLAAMRKQYGSQIPVQPLLPQEAQAITSQLDQSPPVERAQVLTSLRTAFGNDVAYQAAMHQILPDRPVVAIAGQMTGHAQPTTQPSWFDPTQAPNIRDVSRILAGEALLNPTKGTDKEKGGIKSTVVLPPEVDSPNSVGLRSEFARKAGDLFRDRPQLSDAYFSTYKSTYAALVAETGDMSGVFNRSISDKATQIALGNTTDYMGKQIAIPAGMNPTRFTGLVNNAVNAAMKSSGAPSDWFSRIKGYGLQEIGGLGDGRYELTQGNAVLQRADGKGPVTIDLRQQYTFH